MVRVRVRVPGGPRAGEAAVEPGEGALVEGDGPAEARPLAEDAVVEGGEDHERQERDAQPSGGDPVGAQGQPREGEGCDEGGEPPARDGGVPAIEARHGFPTGGEAAGELGAGIVHAGRVARGRREAGRKRRGPGGTARVALAPRRGELFVDALREPARLPAGPTADREAA